MKTQLDTQSLASAVKQKRGNKSLRDIVQEIGEVSPSTLSRIENGKTPDMDTFLRVCDWLGQSPVTFIKTPHPEGEPDTHTIHLQLRADQNLDTETTLALSKAVQAIYDAMKSPKKDD